MSTVSWSLLRKIIVRYVVNRAAGSYCLSSILLDCETWFVRVLQQVRGVVEVSSPGACARFSGCVHTLRHGLHLRTHRLLLHCCWLLPQGLTAWRVISYAHTHARLTALCPGLPGWAGTRKVKPIWILLKQETVSGSGISWAICKSAPRSRQITMPAPPPLRFYRPDALPAEQTNSIKALNA